MPIARTRRRTVEVLPFLLAVALSDPASAQNMTSRSGEPAVAEKAGKEVIAYYVGETPPRIDGRLDDEIWQAAQAVDDMVQNDPDNMQPPTERTLVKVAYDDRSVYVAVMNYMKDPARITTALGRRDTFPRSDSIKITFDPRHDHLTAFTFDANPSGVQGDMMWYDDNRSIRGASASARTALRSLTARRSSSVPTRPRSSARRRSPAKRAGGPTAA